MDNMVKYLSHLVDPYSQDELIDQSDIDEKNYLQYKCDSILNTIATNECKYNIEFYLNEIDNTLDDDAQIEFYRDIFDIIIEKYKLNCLEIYFLNRKYFNYNVEVRNLLIFLEKDYEKFLYDVLQELTDPYLLYDMKKCYNHMLLIYPIIRKSIIEILKRYEELKIMVPQLFKYFLYNSDKKDIIYCLLKLSNKDLNYTINNIILQKGGIER